MTGFRCKQFYVGHDRCGMKVNTDSIVLGAWVCLDGIQRVLDIGTGSSILSLMLAQRLAEKGGSPEIYGVDIDPDAAAQAGDNFHASPWHQALTQQCADICQWQAGTPFDLLISNPPYFGSGQQLDCQKRQQARLEDSLSFAQLFKQAQRLSHANSMLAIIIPAERLTDALLVAEEAGWYLSRQLNSQSKEGKPVNRMVLEFKRRPEDVKTEHLLIREANNQYSAEFKALTGAFYLAF